MEHKKAELHGDVDYLGRHIPNQDKAEQDDSQPNDDGEEEQESNALIIH